LSRASNAPADSERTFTVVDGTPSGPSTEIVMVETPPRKPFSLRQV
jgi:hypothetical protein